MLVRRVCRVAVCCYVCVVLLLVSCLLPSWIEWFRIGQVSAALENPGVHSKEGQYLGFSDSCEYVFVGYVCVRCLVGICFMIVCLELCNSGGGMLSEIAPTSFRCSPEIFSVRWNR